MCICKYILRSCHISPSEFSTKKTEFSPHSLALDVSDEAPPSHVTSDRLHFAVANDLHRSEAHGALPVRKPRKDLVLPTLQKVGHLCWSFQQSDQNWFVYPSWCKQNGSDEIMSSKLERTGYWNLRALGHPFCAESSPEGSMKLTQWLLSMSQKRWENHQVTKESNWQKTKKRKNQTENKQATQWVLGDIWYFFGLLVPCSCIHTDLPFFGFSLAILCNLLLSYFWVTSSRGRAAFRLLFS